MVVNTSFILHFKSPIEKSSWIDIFLSKIQPTIRGKNVLFSFELRVFKKVFENNQNSGKARGKLKYKTAVNRVSY